MKMASKKRFRYSQVRSEEEKQTPSDRADAVRKLLTPKGCPPIDNLHLFTAIMFIGDGCSMLWKYDMCVLLVGLLQVVSCPVLSVLCVSW